MEIVGSSENCRIGYISEDSSPRRTLLQLSPRADELNDSVDGQYNISVDSIKVEDDYMEPSCSTSSTNSTSHNRRRNRFGKDGKAVYSDVDEHILVRSGSKKITIV